eukprot:scaffold34600_cov155-Skeletonema_dohrnii-CCMP3373.AAC.1
MPRLSRQFAFLAQNNASINDEQEAKNQQQQRGTATSNPTWPMEEARRRQTISQGERESEMMITSRLRSDSGYLVSDFLPLSVTTA